VQPFPLGTCKMKKLEKPKVIGKAASSKREFQQLATSEAQELRHKKIPSRGSLRRKKMTDEEKWVKNGRTTVSAIADGGPETDLYLAHLNMILKQVTFRLNMYKLSGDFYDAKVVIPQNWYSCSIPIPLASHGLFEASSAPSLQITIPRAWLLWCWI